MKKQTQILLALTVLLAGITMSCEEGMFGPKNDINDPDAPKGTLSMSITDAPIDAADVSAAFVTFTEIKIDGQTFTGFQGPKTVNLLALQNGNSLNLGSMDVAAGTYSNLELVISSATDEAGNAPGCYIQKTDGTKQALELSGNGTAEISLKPKDFTISENGSTEIIMDFDLRKAIKMNNNKAAFVSRGQLNSAVRAHNKAMTGEITGTIQNYNDNLGGAVVYAYKQGEFNENAEINANGNSEVKYAKAVTSAKVGANGNFTLAFLPEGNYEIHCDMPEENGQGIGLNTLLGLESTVDLSNVGVNAGAQTNLSLTVDLDGLINL
ncbi:DUF4382 domain-containing protein [Jiulongibacter sediminis]|nr:DUF4382 domain-containing protein [Jiulongibacter sediminis]